MHHRHARRKCHLASPRAGTPAAISAAISISCPTPSTSRLTNGSVRKMPLSSILRQEAAGVVAADADRRLRQVVVPKLKNSAVSAISPAISAARGSSIIVPTR